MPGGTGDSRPSILLACRDRAERTALGQELSKRYGADYHIVVCDQPADLGPQMRELLGTGTPVALVIAAVGRPDLGDIEVLAALRALDPTASRVATVRWGDWATTRPLFEAIATGKVDHWVTQPVQTPDEDFHRSITGFLSEWRGRSGGGFEAVRVIGERWSARSQELRDMFSPGTGSPGRLL